METISIGKFRALQQCSTPNGAISVLALDHRGNLRTAMNPSSPDSVSAQDLTAFKQQVVAALAPAASAVLLDPEFGAAQTIAAGTLPGKVGLLVAVEETGYSGDPSARRTRLMEKWSVEKVKRMNASAVKILAYYHPRSDLAGYIEDLLGKVIAECRRFDLPLFVEPISYSPDPDKKKLSPEERREAVIETARRLTPLGVDVLKAEFPVDVSADQDGQHWAEACAALTEASRCPWVLLSASVAFETFLSMVTTACRAGASGVAVGRAVWQEAPTLRGAELAQFLQTTARQRMQRVTAVCDGLGRPWTNYYQAPPVDETWYPGYPSFSA